MELKPHDLIRVDNLDDLLTDLPLPEWAVSALVNAPYVVIRRAVERDGMVPVGIRGSKRSERLAAWMKVSSVPDVISPEMLVSPLHWKIRQDKLKNSILSLKKISPILNGAALKWGPTGSTAFELATGTETLKAESDLDIVIRCNNPLPVKKASSLLSRLIIASLVRMDVQLDTPLGGVSLADYVNASTVLVKTASGPLMAQRDTIWARTESLAGTVITTCN